VGEADFPVAILDQCVMTMGGKERTESGFKAIMESAGLKLMKVWEGSGCARRMCREMFKQCVWRIGKRKTTSPEDDADFKILQNMSPLTEWFLSTFSPRRLLASMLASISPLIPKKGLAAPLAVELDWNRVTQIIVMTSVFP
jgi:hypothetical protein